MANPLETEVTGPQTPSELAAARIRRMVRWCREDITWGRPQRNVLAQGDSGNMYRIRINTYTNTDKTPSDGNTGYSLLVKIPTDSVTTDSVSFTPLFQIIVATNNISGKEEVAFADCKTRGDDLETTWRPAKPKHGLTTGFMDPEQAVTDIPELADICSALLRVAHLNRT